MGIAHLLLDRGDGALHEVRRRPVRLCVADFEEEVPQQRRSLPRVVHLRMKLHRPDAPLRIGDSGHSIRCLRRQMKTCGQFQRLVSMRHPHRQIRGQAVKQRILVDRRSGPPHDRTRACPPTHLAAQMMRDELQPVADAENGHAQIEHLRIGGRRVRVVHRAGAARQHDADRLVRLNFFKGGGAGQHSGKDVLFADAARDQLRVLRAKVQNDDRLGVHVTCYPELFRSLCLRRQNSTNAASRATWKKSDAARYQIPTATHQI